MHANLPFYLNDISWESGMIGFTLMPSSSQAAQGPLCRDALCKSITLF